MDFESWMLVEEPQPETNAFYHRIRESGHSLRFNETGEGVSSSFSVRLKSDGCLKSMLRSRDMAPANKFIRLCEGCP